MNYGSLKNIIMVIFFGLAFGLAYITNTALVPKYKQARIEEKSVNDKLDALTKHLEGIAQAEPVLKSKSKVLDELSIAIPPGHPGLPEVLVDMDDIANSAGVSVQSFSPSLEGAQDMSATAAPNQGSLPLMFTVSGSLTQINEFLTTLYADLITTKVKRVSFSKDEGGTITATISAESVYLFEETKPAAEAAPASAPSPEVTAP